MSGGFLGTQGRADRPLPLSFAYASMKESFDAHQHLGHGTPKPGIMPRNVERRIHEHAALAVS
jgi:hypothetical protein